MSNSLRFTAFLSFLIFALPLYAQNTIGDCSPNGKILINNVFICSQGLTDKEKAELTSIKESLESIASQGPAAARQIRLELLRIADMSNGHFEALQDLNCDISQKIEKLTVKTDTVRMRVDALLMLAYQAPVEGHLAEASQLEGKPKLLYVPTPSHKKTFSQLLSESECKEIDVPNDVVSNNKKLSSLIMITKSMDCKEKQYWFNILPSMKKDQIDRLYEILDTESQKLAALEKEYIREIKCLNTRHLFEWTIRNKKNKNEGSASDINEGEVLNAAVDYMYEGCNLEWAKIQESDVQEIIKIISEYLEEAINSSEKFGSSREGALALGKLYRTETYKDDTKAKYWAYAAYQSPQSGWEALELYVSLLLDRKEYDEAYRVVSNAINKGRIKELKGDSEQAIIRKISLYWWHAMLSRETGNAGDIDVIAIAGYNLSKMLLEKYPSHRYLSQAIFFSGYLAQNHKEHRKEIAEYMDAIAGIAIELYNKEIINAKEFAQNALSLSWYCLFAENYSCSVDIAQKGLQADGEYKYLYTNLAHALVLIGEIEKGKDLYMRHRDIALDGRSWDEVILDDFDKLSLAGIQSKEFEEVRGIMMVKVIPGT